MKIKGYIEELNDLPCYLHRNDKMFIKLSDLLKLIERKVSVQIAIIIAFILGDKLHTAHCVHQIYHQYDDIKDILINNTINQRSFWAILTGDYI